MSLADELRKLQELHSRGALSDGEFARAKAAALSAAAPGHVPNHGDAYSLAVDLDEALTAPRLRTMQIVASALLTGVVAFLTVVLVLGQNNGRGMAPAGGLPIISLVAAMMLAINAPLAFALPKLQTRLALRRIIAGTWQAPRGSDAMAFTTSGAKLMAVRQTTMIVGLALLEGAAFMACIAYLQEGQLFALGLVGAAVVLMLCKFPTESGIRTWLERQANLLSEMREQSDRAAR